MNSFPLQNKRLQCLTLPFFVVGSCEVMNASRHHGMDSFLTVNRRNRGLYRSHIASSLLSSSGRGGAPPFLGDMVSAGLFDSYTGPSASTFISNFLRRAVQMHAVSPEEIRALRREFPNDPLVEIMQSSAPLRRSVRQAASTTTSTSAASALSSLISDWDMQQYAICADAAFFREFAPQRVQAGADSGRGPASSSGGAAAMEVCESGCRGVWFAATVAPPALELQRRREVRQRRAATGAAPPPRRSLETAEELRCKEEAQARRILEANTFCLDVLVSGVGNSRAFGIARNPLTDAHQSILDPTRQRVVPLSVDHNVQHSSEYHRVIRAGGKVDMEKGGAIDGNPFYNVTRSFGHWSMKNNPRLTPVQQKITPLPTSMSWEMLPGDALVMTNHAVYETRLGEDTTTDELAKVVGRALDSGASPEEAAGALCDFAIRYGAEHSLQVAVAVAQASEATGDVVTDGQRGHEQSYRAYVEPGPLYVQAFQNLPEYRDAVLEDCERCAVTLGELLQLRWLRVRHALPQRAELSLRSLYPRECGVLQQVMEEEAMLFDDPSLHEWLSSPALPTGDGVPDARVKLFFDRLAEKLLRSLV